MVEPILYKTRDNPILITEQLVVRGSKAILKEVPDRFYRVKINGFVEIDDIERLNESYDYFYVDYLMGEVHFPTNVINESEFTAEYYGTGYSLYPASRIYLHLQDHNTIEETLQDAIKKAENGIKIVNEISDIDTYVEEGKVLRSDLAQKITNATPINENLASNIVLGNEVNSSLQNAIDTGDINTIKSQLADIVSVGATHIIRPTDNPQSIFNQGVAGDKFVFSKGIHSHNPVNNNAILYADKPCTIEIVEGATLKIPDNVVPFNATAEIIKNFSTVAFALDDLSVGGAYTGTNGVAYAIEIDSVGAVDTFKWSREFNASSTVWQGTNIPITGGFQTLENGIQIKFNAVTGHSLKSLWLVTYGVSPYYGIRVGTGLQEDYIDGVKFIGKGTIDLNKSKQYAHNEYTKFLPACIQVNGRVSNILVDEIKMINAARPIQMYGEHTGVYNLDGTTTGGTSYDVKNVIVKNTRIKDCSVGHIFGFPEHRGKVRNVSFYGNTSENTLPLVELNHGLENYNFQNNFAKSDGKKPLFSLWRYSKNGTIANNFMYDELGRIVDIISINSPSTWQRPKGLVAYNNLLIDTFENGEHALSLIMSNKATGLRSVCLGGKDNVASNNYAAILGGSGNTASGDTSGVVTGLNNNVAASFSAVVVGASNAIPSGSHNAVTNGANNNISVGNYNSVDGSGNAVSGSYNKASGKNNALSNNNCLVVGEANNANKSFCRVFGLEGTTDWNSEDVFASGKFTTVGDVKTSRLLCKGRSTSATFVQLLSNSGEIIIPQNTTVAYTITVVARNEDGLQQGMWTAQGIATRGTGDISLKGNTVTKVFSDSTTWDFQAVAYTPSQSINLKAHGDAGQNVRWVATVELTVVKS